MRYQVVVAYELSLQVLSWLPVPDLPFGFGTELVKYQAVLG